MGFEIFGHWVSFETIMLSCIAIGWAVGVIIVAGNQGLPPSE